MTDTTFGAAWARWHAVAVGGFVAGTVDLAYATSMARPAGASVLVVPQAIASGLLGMAAFRGGAGAAAFGVALHFGILLVAAALYLGASRRWTVLARRPLVFGALYGLAIYLFMHALVLPLSRAPHLPGTPASLAGDLVVHVLLIGPVIAAAIHRARPPRAPAVPIA